MWETRVDEQWKFRLFYISSSDPPQFWRLSKWHNGDQRRRRGKGWSDSYLLLDRNSKKKKKGKRPSIPRAQEKEKEAKAFSGSFIVEPKKGRTDNENSSKLRNLSPFVQNVWNLLVFLQKTVESLSPLANAPLLLFPLLHRWRRLRRGGGGDGIIAQ